MGQSKSTGKKTRADRKIKNSVSQDKSRLQKIAILEVFLVSEVANGCRPPHFFDIKVARVLSVLFRGISSISPHGEQLISYFKP